MFSSFMCCTLKKDWEGDVVSMQVQILSGVFLLDRYKIWTRTNRGLIISRREKRGLTARFACIGFIGGCAPIHYTVML